MYYIVKYRVLLWTGNWARYVDKDIKSQASFTEKFLKYLLNRLTLLYSKIYYEEENYLKVRTKLLIYSSPPHSKGWYVRYMRYMKYIRYVYRSHRSHRSHVPNHVIRLTPYYLILLVLIVLPLAHWSWTNTSPLLVLVLSCL